MYPLWQDGKQDPECRYRRNTRFQRHDALYMFWIFAQREGNESVFVAHQISCVMGMDQISWYPRAGRPSIHQKQVQEYFEIEGAPVNQLSSRYDELKTPEIMRKVFAEPFQFSLPDEVAPMATQTESEIPTPLPAQETN